MSKGKVIIIGAGPGDPDLITIKGLRYLKEADVVLYDFLAPEVLLTHCRSDAKLMSVGKSRGHHSAKQEDIHGLLLKYSKTHKLIVRLKGGDPSVFGRVGEEMQFLAEHQIPFEVVPGVTSATAAPIAAGIPLTFREIARSVAFLTGSTYDTADELAQIRIPNADTLVILMPIKNCDGLCKKILATGYFTADTPSALIAHGTTPNQKVIRATLSTIASHIKEISSPALLVVGEVCKI